MAPLANTSGPLLVVLMNRHNFLMQHVPVLLGAMCHTNSINIESVDAIMREGIWRAYLVANDPPTHLVILLTTSGIAEPLTATSVGPSTTYPVWGGDLLPYRGTLLRGVRHVEVGYTSPAS